MNDKIRDIRDKLAHDELFVCVTRCKDCKWYHQSEGFGTWCEYWDDNTSDWFGYVDNNDYCSKAERRESDVD